MPIDFTLSNANRFYSSKGDPLGVKELNTLYLVNVQNRIKVQMERKDLRNQGHQFSSWPFVLRLTYVLAVDAILDKLQSMTKALGTPGSDSMKLH